ncbi:MAG: PEGA domain-containing protein [bacterium]
MNRIGWTLCVMSALLVGTGAIAAPAEPARPGASDGSAKAKAKAHFQKGEEYYQQYMFKQALQEYKKGMRYKQDPAFLYNIAQCYRQLKDYKKAAFYYRLYLVDAPTAPNKEAVLAAIIEMKKKIAEQQAAEAAWKGKRSTVSISSTPSGAEVLLDNKLAGRTPAALKVTVGTHQIIVRRTGYQEKRRTIAVSAGRDLAVDLALIKQAAPRPVIVKKDSTEVRTVWRNKWLFWTGLVLTVAAGATAVAFGVMTGSKHNAYKDMDPDDPGLDDARKEGKKLALTTDVMIGVSATLLVGTVLAYVLSRKKVRERTSTLLVPGCGATGCGLVLRGGF